ncbi:lysozyme inhibitor LprI family protein [Rhizobium sp. 2YAF20]|uniref:lysozyme inhibitor LprI family protein n=1 Tax=Rhizobium sp. 2YAF20 TaxID=3233027 RepID=UPI003F9CEB35
MRLQLLLAGVALSILFAFGPARADDAADCGNAATQMDMNSCSDQDYQAADAELNAQYKKTRAAMLELDTGLDASLRGAEKALLAGQRAWIDYRDGECEAEGFQARGGSMEPMLVSGCKATLTRARTKELKQLADGPGN